MLNPSKEFNQVRIDKIKREMGAHEITKSSLANKLQISRESLTNKLSGITPWTVAELEMLAEIFNKRRNYFF